MDINISANTLFHFTSNESILQSILLNGIYARFSLENFESILNADDEIAIPMACFCDIPLSQIKRHTSTYGSYAIGMSKAWGMKNKINPVIYTYPNSTTSEVLNDLYADLENFFDIGEEAQKKIDAKKPIGNKGRSLSEMLNDPTFLTNTELRKKTEKLINNLSHFLKYIKPYQGKFFRNGQYLSEPVNFYQEREWRFVPKRENIHEFLPKDSFEKDFFKKPAARRLVNMRIRKGANLKFTPNDVRFIVVKKDSEIPLMIKYLDEIYGSIYPQNDLRLLYTRLISLDQILEDF